jgi:hypothetical protein
MDRGDYSRDHPNSGSDPWVAQLSDHTFETELRAHFGEAWISGYEPLIPRMTNDDKDRHVAAAAVHGNALSTLAPEAAIILTFNLRHFRPEHLARWRVRALHPQSFLIEIFRQEQAVVMTKLAQQAANQCAFKFLHQRPHFASTPEHPERNGTRFRGAGFRRNAERIGPLTPNSTKSF